MEIQINKQKPLIMHIDLNSCFATIEQQANPLLRGKPLVVAAYDTPNGCILAPSTEAKRLGIKTGMRIKDARLLSRDIIIRTPDPSKYRDVQMRFSKIFADYSPDVTPKSIDESIIDFHPVKNLKPDLQHIAQEIKARMKTEIGEWITCSIGISTNMFLAKLGASLHKPDGLDVIDHTNILKTYQTVSLIDFCGINVRYKARLNLHGIKTPIDFFHASRTLLEKRVFRSVIGGRWYEKLRGYEADQKATPLKSIGHQYALHAPTNNPEAIARLLMKLCEKMGRRLRKKSLVAQGIHVWLRYNDYTSWHKGKLMERALFTTMELYTHALFVLNNQPTQKVITLISVSCYHLTPQNTSQMTLFDGDYTKPHNVTKAMDTINDTFGEFTVTSGIMIGMDNVIKDSIAFGGLR
jgi:DNA polymerase-4